MYVEGEFFDCDQVFLEIYDYYYEICWQELELDGDMFVYYLVFKFFLLMLSQIKICLFFDKCGY